MTAARVQSHLVARGAGRGFNVLLLGGLVAPFAAAFLGAVGALWLALVAVVAFIVAGRTVREAERPALHGALAALGSYFLIFPLVIFLTRVLDLTQLSVTSLTALVVGAAAARLTVRVPEQTLVKQPQE